MDNSNIGAGHPPEQTTLVPPQGGNLELHRSPKRPFTPGIQPGDIKLDNMPIVQEIQSMHPDFEKLNEYEQTNLRISLAQAGLPETGAVLNTIA